MTDEPNEMTEPSAPATVEAEVPAKSGGFPKIYLLMGVIGLLVVALAVVTTLWLVGGDEPTAEAEPETTSEVVHATPEEPSQEASTDHADEHAQAPEEDIPEFDPYEPVEIDEDSGVLEDIMANLEFLDYEPEMTDVPGEEGGSDSKISREDSIEAANWIETEMARLAEKEAELNQRQKELERLDKIVSQKVLKLEQAESSRIAALARLYDGMDPRAVAKLVANLDDATVVSILPRMKQKNASQVLSLMPAARAAKLSKQMITIAEN
ncbi:hypothetical protein GF420_16445 [candidate division GN15 bacterium]|nr:hypothetical protein [candidate division GN15 bacterium]